MNEVHAGCAVCTQRAEKRPAPPPPAMMVLPDEENFGLEVLKTFKGTDLKVADARLGIVAQSLDKSFHDLQVEFLLTSYLSMD
jgi:hypothetical protein